jgi:hypothetical protein
MATNNAVNTSLNGQTGTGNFVGSISPQLITPNIGAATATSVQFNPSTDGVIGTTTNNNAATGVVGEFVMSQVLQSSAIAVTASGVSQNLTSISLTAGDWDVSGNVAFTGTGSTLTEIIGAISTISATLPDLSEQDYIAVGAGSLTGGVASPSIRISVATTTTVYLVIQAVFGSTLQACGIISARRRR